MTEINQAKIVEELLQKLSEAEGQDEAYIFNAQEVGVLKEIMEIYRHGDLKEMMEIYRNSRGTWIIIRSVAKVITVAAATYGAWIVLKDGLIK